MRSSNLRLVAAASLGLIGASPAFAFDVPDGQSCGGLVCDLGLFGHKTAPAPAPSAPVPLPAAPVRVAAPVAAAEAVVPRKHVAKTMPPVVRARAVAKAEPVVVEAVAPPPAKARPARKVESPVGTATLQDFAPDSMTMAGSAPALPAPPPPPPREPVVLADPYVTLGKAAPLAFQSVDPTVGLR